MKSLLNNITSQVWLQPANAKGLEVSGTFALKQGSISMDMLFTNRALQGMGNFEIQFNKNRYPLSLPLLW